MQLSHCKLCNNQVEKSGKKKAAEIYAELDTGKIRALAYGGWSLKDIAEEVGCSTDVAAEVIKGWINGR